MAALLLRPDLLYIKIYEEGADFASRSGFEEESLGLYIKVYEEGADFASRNGFEEESLGLTRILLRF